MIKALKDIDVAHDEPVSFEQIPLALTAGNLVYDDNEGRFCSFWPPSYRACYRLRWIVEGGTIVGLRFTELQGRWRLDGRYR